jgi:hypothetical protein
MRGRKSWKRNPSPEPDPAITIANEQMLVAKRQKKFLWATNFRLIATFRVHIARSSQL